MSKVTVTANAAGAVVIPSKNPEFGYVRLEQVSNNIDDEGWVRKATKSALIKGAVADLKGLGFNAGMQLDGQIVVSESTTPSNPNDLEQDKKMAGQTGVPCTIEGNSIYRTARYTKDMEALDSLIKHDNVDAIKAAQAVAEEAAEEAAL